MVSPICYHIHLLDFLDDQYKNKERKLNKLFEAVKDLKLVIFSGNLDECKFANELIKNDFSTKIFFSQSKIYPQDGLINLAKYTVEVISNKYKGVINLGE